MTASQETPAASLLLRLVAAALALVGASAFNPCSQAYISELMGDPFTSEEKAADGSIDLESSDPPHTLAAHSYLLSASHLFIPPSLRSLLQAHHTAHCRRCARSPLVDDDRPHLCGCVLSIASADLEAVLYRIEGMPSMAW